jgi:hypothetical protein
VKIYRQECTDILWEIHSGTRSMPVNRKYKNLLNVFTLANYYLQNSLQQMSQFEKQANIKTCVWQDLLPDFSIHNPNVTLCNGS